MKITIPKQLRNMKFRFIKLRSGSNSKKASEKNWHDSYHYKYDEVAFKDYLKQATGYGVLCGFGKLAVIDCDKEEFAKAMLYTLPPTFSVITGSGGLHLYYIIPDLDKKIIITDSKDVHHGEVQFTKSYVVGAESHHPSGNTYAVKNDAPIKTITKKKLFEALEPFLKKKNKFVETVTTGLNWDIGVILEKLGGIKEQRETDDGVEHWGEHPVHGSKDGDEGSNFNLNPTKGVWHCYRCDTGGDALSLIAMLNGLVKCEDCKPGFFSTKEGIEVFHKAKKIGAQKYGFEDNRILLFHKGKRPGALLVQEIVEHIKLSCRFIVVQDATGRLPHIYVYKDGYYNLNGEDLIKIELKKILNNQGVPYKTQYERDILNYVKTENMVERDKINPAKNLLNFNNGTYDTDTRKLRPHNSDDYFLYKIPWNYKPQAECPKVMKYLKSTLKPEFMELTQEIFGYCLMFDYRHAAIFYLYGTGGNGKKIWTKMLEHMLGTKNVTNKSIDSLVRFRFTSALLYGKLANICGELTTSVLHDTDMLKGLSGGDSIQAEFKGKDGFDFENKAKIITACNSIPDCRDSTDGWYQRQYILPFLEKFRHTKQEDTELLDKLLVQKEMEGLLAWSLVGMHRLLKNKRFSYPDDKEERYLMYRENTLYFVQKFYVKTSEFSDTVKSDEIYADYVKWCKKNNIPADSRNALGRTLTNMKITYERVLEEGHHSYTDIRRYIKKV